MDLLLILTYAAICIVIFKVFKNPSDQMDGSYCRFGGRGAHRCLDTANEL